MITISGLGKLSQYFTFENLRLLGQLLARAHAVCSGSKWVLFPLWGMFALNVILEIVRILPVSHSDLFENVTTLRSR